jgi:hypothetical protein
MTEQKTCRYRGYQIDPHLECSKWRVTIHPMRPELPILSHSTLRTVNHDREEAVADARRHIDELLLPLGEWLD